MASDPYAAFREFGREGGKARAAKLTPQRRSAIARKAGKASAKKRREQKEK